MKGVSGLSFTGPLLVPLWGPSFKPQAPEKNPSIPGFNLSALTGMGANSYEFGPVFIWGPKYLFALDI